MNIFLWVLQVGLALHTAIGAIWKFSHTAEQTMPTLKAIPYSAWLVLLVLELLCALALIIPAFSKSLAFLVPVAAILVAAEMLLFSGLHIASGNGEYGPVIYWLVVVAVCLFIAYGRMALRPF